MAVKFGNSFEITTYESIDTRLVLTKAEMLAIIGDDDPSVTPGDHMMPEVYFAFCSDDLSWYSFDYNATPNAETGKFTKVADGSEPTVVKSGTSAEMAAALATAKEGDLFYNTTDGKLYIAKKDGSGNLQWVEDTPSKGKVVFDESAGKLKYFDGTSWKEVGGNAIVDVTTLPSSPNTGVIYRLSNDKSLNIVDADGNWKQIPTASENGEIKITKDVTALPTSPVDGVIYALKDAASSTDSFRIYRDGQWYELSLSWEGTQAEYDAIATKNPSTTYYITD